MVILVVLIVMLILLTLLGAFGGSIRYKEKYSTVLSEQEYPIIAPSSLPYVPDMTFTSGPPGAKPIHATERYEEEVEQYEEEGVEPYEDDTTVGGAPY